MKQKKTPLKSWETATSDGLSESNYIRLGQSLLYHPAFCTMKPLSQMVYIRMIEHARGKSAFVFPKAIYSKSCSIGGFNSAKAELIERGFIEIVEDNRYTGKETKYHFILDWRNYTPPSF